MFLIWKDEGQKLIVIRVRVDANICDEERILIDCLKFLHPKR